VKNVQKSALALTLLMTGATQAIEMPALPEISMKNGAIALGVAGVAGVAYKYRDTIKDGVSTVATKVGNGCTVAKDFVMNNKGKVAVGVALVAAVLVYKKYLASTTIEIVPTVTPEGQVATPANPVVPVLEASVTPEVTPQAPVVAPTVSTEALVVTPEEVKTAVADVQALVAKTVDDAINAEQVLEAANTNLQEAAKVLDAGK